MKIAIYSPTFYPVKDGTSIQASRMAKQLSTDYQVFSLCYAVDRDIQPQKHLLSIRDGVDRLPSDCITNIDKQRKFPKLSGKAVASRLENIMPDIIHIRGWYQFDASTEIISRLSNLNTRIYWHGDGLQECHEANKRDIEYYHAIWHAISHEVNFIGNSSQDTKMFLGLGIPSPNIFEIAPFLQETSRPSRDWNSPRVLSVGRFFEYKRHDLVIKAVKKIHPEQNIVIAGASDTAYFKEFIKRYKTEAKIMASPSEGLLNILYDSSTHFVLASEVETLGIATLEAVNSGCVPLARKIGGITSYLHEELLFQANNELESKLRFLLDPSNAITANDSLSGLRKRLSNRAILEDLQKIYIQSPKNGHRQ